MILVQFITSCPRSASCPTLYYYIIFFIQRNNVFVNTLFAIRKTQNQKYFVKTLENTIVLRMFNRECEVRQGEAYYHSSPSDFRTDQVLKQLRCQQGRLEDWVAGINERGHGKSVNE